jgi:hypothetical protein
MTRRSLMSEAGALNVQTLILIAVLALGGIAGVRTLKQGFNARAECAGEQIGSLQVGAGRCGGDAEGDPAAPPVSAPSQAAARSSGCGGSESPPTDPGGLDRALADPGVQAELERAWNESNPDGPGDQKHEQGGWIVLNRETGEYEVIRWPAGSRDGIRPGPQPDGDKYTLVGWFHTHPNTEAEGYSPDPSPADINFTNDHARVPGVIETHDGRKNIPFAGQGSGGGFAGPPARGDELLPWAVLLLLWLRPLRRARSAAMVLGKVVQLHGEAIMSQRMSLYLGLLMCAVAPVMLGCQHERPSQMTDAAALSPDEQRRVNKAAEDHILQKKSWQRSEFRIELRGLSKDSTAAVVWAVHADDERSPTAGRGKSLALHVDRKSLKVIKELRFQ